jgi:fumarate reductase flavoprotein subunit
VIADGGFQANIDLVGRHISPAGAKLMQRNAGTGLGEGLHMATEIGAATVGLETFYGHVLSRDAMTNDRLWPYPQVDVICAKSIVVDGTGRRFADEGLGGIFLANAIARLDDPLSAVAVFDSTVWDDARETDNVPPNPALQEAGGTVIEAPDINALAQRAGIDPARLSATVEAHNRFVRTGSADVGTPPRTTRIYTPHTLERPPFYAIPLCAGITVTSGGISVNGRAQVLGGDDSPIPGLYAAGSCVGGLEGGPACGYVGGLIKAFAIGLIAGDSLGEDLAE